VRAQQIDQAGAGMDKTIAARSPKGRISGPRTIKVSLIRYRSIFSWREMLMKLKGAALE